MNKRIAVIDLGTNTARLLIADRLDQGGFMPICIEREIVRLGGGFTHEQGLSDDAIQRGLACLKNFSASIERHGASSSVRAVATSAVRDALNGAAFREMVRTETGISLAVINGFEEGTITLAGVMAGLDQSYPEILLVDVGGGSTEFTLVRDNVTLFVESLPLGVVRLTEGKCTVEAISQKIGKELGVLRERMEKSGCCPCTDVVLIGTAGSATTLAAICLEMEDYDYRKVNNFVISRHEIQSIFNRLLALTPAERLAIPGLEKGREDLIIAGTLIFLETMELFGIESMKTSDYGLLEGLVVTEPAVP